MAKTFTVLVDESDCVNVEFTLPPHMNLDDVMEQFTMFLRACGYYFDGRVDIVDEEHP